MKSRLKYFIVPILGFAGLVAFSYKFSSVFTYFIISLIISALLSPVTEKISRIYFMKRRVPRGFAVAMAFLLLISVLIGFVTLFIPLISEQITILSDVDFTVLLSKMEKPIGNMEHFIINTLDIKQKSGFIMKSLQENLMSFVKKLDFGTITGNIISSVISFSSGLSAGVLAVMFITFFLLYQKGLFKRNFLSIVPNQYFELTVTTVHKVERSLANYLLGLSIQISSIFIFTSIGLSIIGVNYALTIALLAAIINIVPYIGPLIGTTFAIILGVSTANLPTADAYFWLGMKIIILAVIVHVIDNFVSQPVIFSKSVKAHPLEIFTAIFIGADLAGPVGMIAAIPVYTILRVSIIELNQGYDQYRIFQAK